MSNNYAACLGYFDRDIVAPTASRQSQKMMQLSVMRGKEPSGNATSIFAVAKAIALAGLLAVGCAGIHPIYEIVINIGANGDVAIGQIENIVERNGFPFRCGTEDGKTASLGPGVGYARSIVGFCAYNPRQRPGIDATIAIARSNLIVIVVEDEGTSGAVMQPQALELYDRLFHALQQAFGVANVSNGPRTE